MQGASVLLSSYFGKQDWVRDGKARVLLHFATERIRTIPDTPTAIELVDDADAKLMLRTYAAKYKATYPMVLPPGVPEDRIKALRDGFDAAMKDPALIAEAKRFGVDIDPLPGLAIERLMKEIDEVPRVVIDRLKKIIDP